MDQGRQKNQMLAFRANKSWANAKKVTKVQPSLDKGGMLADREIGLEALLEIRRELKQKK